MPLHPASTSPHDIESLIANLGGPIAILRTRNPKNACRCRNSARGGGLEFPVWQTDDVCDEQDRCSWRYDFALSDLRPSCRLACSAGAVGCAVAPPRWSLRVPCSMNTSTYRRLSSTVSTTRKLQAMTACAWAARNCRQVGPDRRGAGSMPAACKISHTVDAAIEYPRRANSPWILLCPHAGFSCAIRTISVLIETPVDGRPGRRR